MKLFRVMKHGRTKCSMQADSYVEAATKAAAKMFKSASSCVRISGETGSDGLFQARRVSGDGSLLPVSVGEPFLVCTDSGRAPEETQDEASLIGRALSWINDCAGCSSEPCPPDELNALARSYESLSQEHEKLKRDVVHFRELAEGYAKDMERLLREKRELAAVQT